MKINIIFKNNITHLLNVYITVVYRIVLYCRISCFRCQLRLELTYNRGRCVRFYCVMYESAWSAVAAGLRMNYKLRELETQEPLVA
jgi:hypothetical protein